MEPVTGAPVYGEEIHQEELRGGTLLGGRAKVTAFAGHVKMREDYIRSTVALVKHNRTLVLMLTSRLPWGPPGRGPRPAPGGGRARQGAGARPGHRLSRALVCRVGSAPAGSSGQGCLG